MRLPAGCLKSCLSLSTVAYFWCANSHREFRKLCANRRSRMWVTGLPTLATFPKQATQCCLTSCLTREVS